MRKRMLCLLLVLCLFLSMILVSCKEEPAPEAPQTEEGPRGQTHPTPDAVGDVVPNDPNPFLPGLGDSLRY